MNDWVMYVWVGVIIGIPIGALTVGAAVWLARKF